MSLGGGGGNSQTTQSGIDPEFKPYLKEVLSDVTDRYKEEAAGGHTNIVAGLTPQQREAMAYQQQLGRDMSQGITDEQIANQLSQASADAALANSMQGNLNNTWGAKAREQALVNRALDLQDIADKRRMTGAQTLGEVGTNLQTQRQRELDAPHTSAQRYFGYLQGAPQSQTTSQGGGK